MSSDVHLRFLLGHWSYLCKLKVKILFAETNFPSVCTQIVANMVQWTALISINCIVVMNHLNLGRRFCSYTRDFVTYNNIITSSILTMTSESQVGSPTPGSAASGTSGTGGTASGWRSSC